MQFKPTKLYIVWRRPLVRITNLHYSTLAYPLILSSEVCTPIQH